MTDPAATPPGSSSSPTPDASASGVGRRRLLQGAVGGLAVGALAGVGATRAAASGSVGPVDVPQTGDLVDLSVEYPFYGEAHPVGVATKPQRYAVFMAFDVVAGTSAAGLQAVLARWSAAIAQLMKGQPIGQIEPTRSTGIGQDTGEADGLGPAALTVTVGLGPALFDDRFGLAARKPALLAELPALPSDQLRPEISGGDLSVQACAEDPQVAYHAVRNLARMARGSVETRWTVMGFGRASAGPGQETPRNLMGFKDGTRNVTTDDDYAQHVWVQDAGWMTGGTYQVARKIEMDIEIWDADPVSDQQVIFGRTKTEGAPLTGKAEMDTPDFAAKDAKGSAVMPPISHVALAAHENNDGVKILRRGYNYTDGINAAGQLDAGLLFIAYMNDPAHFVTLQRRLGSSDRLNEYISHIGSGIWAVPPSPQAGHYIAQDLFS